MKKFLFFLLFIAIGFDSGLCFAEAPNQVAGFQLGANISEYKNRVDMTTALPIRYAESITEVEIKKTDLLTSGLIAYGTCAAPGKIVRIKLKYADSGRAFYDKLLAHFDKNSENLMNGEVIHFTSSLRGNGRLLTNPKTASASSFSITSRIQMKKSATPSN